mgnify:CR=1 FL=1
MLEDETSDIPPIQQGDFEVPQAPPSWPKVIGVICIVLGALGILSNLWQAVAPYVFEAMLSSMAENEEMKATMQVQKDYMVWLAVAAILGVACSAMLVIGGSGLCMLRRWGHATLKLYIPVRMLVVVFAVVLTFIMTEATHKAMAGSGQAVPMSSAIVVVVAAIGLAWGWAMPVFLWIWFSRPKVKAFVASWK